MSGTGTVETDYMKITRFGTSSTIVPKKEAKLLVMYSCYEYDTRWYIDVANNSGNYVVTFNPSGGEISAGYDSFKLVAKGDVYGELPPAERKGYIFDGWYTQYDGGEIVTPSTLVSAQADHNLYAHWKDAPASILKLDPNGGSVSPETVEIIGGRQYWLLPVPERKGYIFTGWYRKKEGGGNRISRNDTFEPDEVKTLYAHWTEAVEGTLSDNIFYRIENATLTVSGNGYMRPPEDNYAYPWDPYFDVIMRVEIEDGVKSIGDEAFYAYPILEEVISRSKLDYIGEGAFKSCRELRYVDVSRGLKEIGDYAFSSCMYLTSINMSEDLQTIGKKAFSNSSMESIVIPDSVTSIGERAFEHWFEVFLVMPAGIERVEAECPYLEDQYLGIVAFPGLKYFAHDSYLDIYSHNDFEMKGENADKIILEEDQYFINLNANGGNVWRTDDRYTFTVGTKDEVYPKLKEPELTVTSFRKYSGLKFAGWFTEREGGTRVIGGVTKLTVNRDHTLYAHWDMKGIDDDPDTPVNPDDPDTPVNPDDPDTPVNPDDPDGPDDRFDDHGNPVSKYVEGRSGLDPALITIEANAYMVKGQTYRLPSDETWSSDDNAVVKISGKNSAKALKGGTAKLTGSAGTVYVARVAEPMLEKKKTLVIGENAKLELKGLDGYEDDYALTWLTDDPRVAKVGNGVVYATGKGKTKITLWINGKSYTCQVQVRDKYEVSAFEDTVKLAPNQTVQVRYSDGFKVKNAVWSSSRSLKTVMKGKKVSYYHDDVVKITPNGKITAIGCGSTDLTVENNGVTKNFKVTVMNIGQQCLYLNYGAFTSVKYDLVKTSGETAALWKSSDPSVAQVSNKGKVKGNKPGKATVTCGYDPCGTGNGFSYSTVLYVEDPSLEVYDGLEATGKGYALSLDRGAKYRIKVNNVFQTTVFKSNKNAVAFVDEAGVIYARGQGKAVLSAKVNGKKLNITVTVGQ